MNNFIIIIWTILICFTLKSNSQAIYEDKRYVSESDSLVNEKLSEWQDLKFGLLMHWGTYSQWGIVESWSLCPEEYGWCERKKGSNPDDYFTYKKEYENLKTTFNPTKFNPDLWAKAAKDAGMRYVVFTTKHHDGFCMFDSKYTDYKITDDECPFSKNERSNIALEIFNSFRNLGLWAGAYFSKPDWNCDYYWDPKYPPRDRNVNYSPSENPEIWSKYVDFTHNQIIELLSDYGKIDILWLDGGWVAKTPKSEITSWYDKKLANSDDGYLKHRIINQDIKMDSLVIKAREKQPGLIVVDRAVHGKNQNYLTPENRIPEKPLPYPWESCKISSSGGWAHGFGAEYISGHKGVQMLVDIVSKGGNLLLNIAPTPEGEFQQGAYRLLNDYAEWMKINSEAIYEIKVLPPYKVDNICMTQKKSGEKYFYYMAYEDETTMPAEIEINGIKLGSVTNIKLLGSKNLKWEPTKNGFKIFIPEEIRNNPPCDYVWVFKAY